MQNNCRRMTFQVKMQVTGLNHYLNLLLAQVFSFFNMFSNQLPDFYIIGTLDTNGLKPNIFNLIKSLLNYAKKKIS